MRVLAKYWLLSVLMVGCISILHADSALAASKNPPALDPAAEREQQMKGQFPIMERNQTLAPSFRPQSSDNAASGQSAPGIMRYQWRPDFVMAVRTRELMATTIYLPEWERISDVLIGDPVAVSSELLRANILILRPAYPGADTNVTVLGMSGNLYPFYVRSDAANSSQLTDFAVYVYVDKGANVATVAEPAPAVTTPAVTAIAPLPAVAQPQPSVAAQSALSTENRTVYFAFGQSSLSAAEQAKLDKLVVGLAAVQQIESVDIVGHTDRIGSQAANQRLSEQRVQAVKDYLEKKGSKKVNQISVEAVGAAQPTTTCSSKKRKDLISCLSPDRRVTVALNYRR
jgi:outer membrane protein OmpA-like peptidoglycan-associated protein